LDAFDRACIFFHPEVNGKHLRPTIPYLNLW